MEDMSTVQENVIGNSVDRMTDDTNEKKVTFLGKKVKGISGSTIKLIAIITMFIDHTAATILDAIVRKQLQYEQAHNILNENGYYPVYDSTIMRVDNIMRAIGRIAFPLFCFLLIEGFIHTRSRVKYMIRLALFAIISEVPFDLAFNQKVMDNSYQNVFFTLFLGFATITVIDAIIQKCKQHTVLKVILSIAIVAVGCILAILLKTDYDMSGVITIFIMYLLRKYKTATIYGGCMSLTLFNLFEAYAFVDIIPVALYNGTRGLKMKYFFYIFYPAHLLLLFGICKLCGLY